MAIFILAISKDHPGGKWCTVASKAVVLPVVAAAAALVAEAAAGPGPAAVPAVHAAVPAAPAGEDPSRCWPAAASGTSPREHLERLHEIQHDNQHHEGTGHLNLGAVQPIGPYTHRGAHDLGYKLD